VSNSDSTEPKTQTGANTLYVLDSHGLIYQMFHGIGPMSAPDGRPTNAVFGVTRALMNLYDQGAEYLLAAMDLPGPTFRSKLFDEYKAHRDPPPDDLLVQEPMILQVLEAMRIPVLTVEEFEADDIMATLAVEGVARGLTVNLCTSDKDCRQLLSNKVKIQNLRKGETLDVEGLKKDWGVEPRQVIDFQALVGDSVDNVPGISGCGPKTAAKWLQQYDTLDNIIANADFLSGPKLKESFKKAVADGSLAQSKTLVALRTDVPLSFDWDSWRRREWDGSKLLELFQTFGFRGFANRVKQTLTKSGAKKNADLLESIGESKDTKAATISTRQPGPPRQGSLFDTIYEESEPGADFPFGALAQQETWKSDYQLVNSPDKFAQFLDELRQVKRFCFDLETTGLDPICSEIVGIAFCWEASKAYYLPLLAPAGEQILPTRETLESLRPIFSDPAIQKLNHNIKFDWIILQSQGIPLHGVAGDSMIAHYLLHAGERSHGLDDLSRSLLKHENIPITDLLGKGKNQLTMDQVMSAKVLDYACEDADTAFRLCELLEPQLEAPGLRKLYDELEMPLIPVLAEMERTGIRLDVPFLGKLSEEMEIQLNALEKEIHQLAGRVVNIGSPKQLREVLFDELKLPVQKRTGTTGDASTDQESLEKLAAMGHELPKRIMEHRQIAKLKGTYVDALPSLVNPKTNRLHTSFNQTVASTGRLSSSDPNLQNIPMRTEQGRQIRQAFLPQEGWKLLTADYSQVELRLLAHFCEDEALQQAFRDDRDIHAAVAAQIFAIEEPAVTAEQRRVAKTVNFGIIYGMSASGLSQRLTIPKKEADQFIASYFARYPKVLGYQDNLIKNARKNGYVQTILGRRRNFEPTGFRTKTNYQNRTQAEREAINMEIQGSAADLMKLALIAIDRRLRTGNLQAKMLLTVHDELVFECPDSEVQPLSELVRTEMTRAMELAVPLKVDVSVGLNWLDGEEL
jgi:DNA polymerase I